MERVAFLIERTNERVGCLLNPESLVVRRVAGVRPRRSATGLLTGAAMTDDPLLYTGGGRTEVDLDLLFDVSLAGSSISTEDVRDLTAPLWRLAENARRSEGARDLSAAVVVRFIWGKLWNIPGVVTAVAERFEHFTPAGAPRRSWLRMRLVRISEEAPPAQPSALGSLAGGASLPLAEVQEQAERAAETALATPAAGEEVGVHQVLGGGDGSAAGASERLDEISSETYDDPALWRLIALFNDIADPLRIPAGLLLRLPPLAAAGKRPGE